MAPNLVINPRSDDEFSRAAQGLVDAGSITPDQLETELRVSYLLAVVRGRLLSGESQPTWYLYREGHWIPND